MTSFVEVDKETFYASIGPQNVVPQIVNDRHPYTQIFVTRTGVVKGKTIDYMVHAGREETQYLLPSKEAT